MRALLLPVKLRDNAKQRLAPLFGQDDRRALMSAMIEDGFTAAAAARAPERIYLVTADPTVAEIAARRGWRVIFEQTQTSESASVDAAAAICARQGVTRLLRLPMDLPCVTGADIDAVLTADDSADAIIVPSRDGTGTNAILRAPPTLFPSHFGPNSLEKHRAEADRAGARLVLVENLNIAMDVDDEADLRHLLAHFQPGPATTAWLAGRNF